MSRQIKITVSDELHAKLAAYCKARCEVTIQGLIRIALDRYMHWSPRGVPKSPGIAEDRHHRI